MALRRGYTCGPQRVRVLELRPQEHNMLGGSTLQESRQAQYASFIILPTAALLLMIACSTDTPAAIRCPG